MLAQIFKPDFPGMCLVRLSATSCDSLAACGRRGARTASGLAGALFGHSAGYVTNETFDLVMSITLLLMIVIGGSSIWFFTPSGWPQAAAAAMIMLGILTVLSLNTCTQCQDDQD